MLMGVFPLFRVALVGLTCAFAGFSQAAPLVEILQDELNRNFATLKEKGDPAPYFIAYTVTETQAEVATASLGVLHSSNRTHRRILDVSVRVGDRTLDNYRQIRGEQPRFTVGTPITLDDQPDAIRRRVWSETDRTYRLAAQRLIKIKTDTQVKVEAQDSSDDFSEEDPSVSIEPVAPLRFPMDEWTPRLRKLSAEFLNYSEIITSQITLMAQRETKVLVNTEGTRVQHGRAFYRVVIGARAKASDGMDLATSESFEADDPSRLPKDDAIRAAIQRVAKDLTALLNAPVVDPYVGPAILSGRASGVFFHEIFGHRIEGHRQKDETDGQTFTRRLNEPVLPEFLSVIFDPTRRQIEGVDLNGWYKYDDEGVEARRVPVVENGILKTFLMSRSPAAGFNKSNGHGRKQPGLEVVSRQSNLIVESTKKVSDTQLRQMLIDEVKRQGKPYGLYFEQVTGGFTTTGRRGFQAFKVIPLVVYRVYPDGRPDELVRGADIVGTPLASFEKIVATSDKLGIFNGYCGAESGNVPVSAVSPAILVSELEIQKNDAAQDRPPLLGRPPAGGRP